MTQPKENTQNNKSENNPPPIINVGDIKTGKNIQESHHHHKSADHPTKKPNVFKRVITFFGNDKKQPHVANIVSFGMLTATIFLAVYTLQVLHQTRIQANAAITAANDADASVIVGKQTLKADTDYNNKVYRQSRIDAAANDKREEARDKRSEKNLKIQNDLLHQQIRFLKETQKEFEIDNRPFIISSNFTVDVPVIGKKINASVIFQNSGKHPAMIINSGYQIFITADTTQWNFKMAYDHTFCINYLLPNGQALPFNWTSERVVRQEDINIVSKDHPLFAYSIGYFKYREIHGKKIYNVKFCYRIDTAPPHAFKVIYYKED